MIPETAVLSPNGLAWSQGGGPLTRLHVATIDGMVTLARPAPGQSWSVRDHSLKGHHLSALLPEPSSGALVAAAHGAGGLWISADGAGRDWAPIESGVSHKHIYALARTGPAARPALIAGANPAFLYRSDDLGKTWRELPALRRTPDIEHWTFPAPPHIAHVKSLTAHPRQADCFFVLVEQGALLRTEDGGESFTEISSYSTPEDRAYRDMHRLLIDPSAPERMFLATGEGLYRSKDSGQTWVHLTGPDDRLGYPDHLFLDPLASKTLYMAGTDTDPGHWFQTGATRPGLLISADEGATWRETPLPIPEPAGVPIEAMSQHVWRDADGRATGHTLALATVAGHILTSDDGGLNWSVCDTPIAAISKDHHHLPFLPRGGAHH